jgi:hypothetical protein
MYWVDGIYMQEEEEEELCTILRGSSWRSDLMIFIIFKIIFWGDNKVKCKVLPSLIPYLTLYFQFHPFIGYWLSVKSPRLGMKSRNWGSDFKIRGEILFYF